MGSRGIATSVMVAVAIVVVLTAGLGYFFITTQAPVTEENMPHGPFPDNQPPDNQPPQENAENVSIFHFLKSITVDMDAKSFGGIVYDGENVVVSYNSNKEYAIWLRKYTTSLEPVTEPLMLDPEITFYGDHKHLFLDNFHYIVVGSNLAGQWVFSITKLNRNLEVVDYKQVEYDYPSNDGFLTTDGNYIYAGFFYPKSEIKNEVGHNIFVYDKDLNFIENITITKPAHRNGAGAIFVDGNFHLFSSHAIATTYPPPPSGILWILCDNNFSPISENAVTIVDTERYDSFPTGVAYDERNNRFYVAHDAAPAESCDPPYVELDNGRKESIMDVVLEAFDYNFTTILDNIAVSSPGSRGHLLLLDDTLYVVYDAADCGKDVNDPSAGVFINAYKIE